MDAVTDGRYRIIGFGGGIRGTKTWGLLSTLIALCTIYPRSRWAVVRKDLPTLRRNTLPSFEKLRERANGFVGSVKQDTWTSKCANGSEIIFFPESLDVDPDLSRWKGLEVNGFGLEEADELSDRSYVKAIERAGTWIIPGAAEQPTPFIIATFNPCGNWPKRVFYTPWRDGTLAPPYAFIPATQADNPFISDEQRAAWKSMPPQEYKRFVEGDWTVLAGRFYDSLNAQVHFIQREELPTVLPGWWEYWGAYDWGYQHWAVFGSFCKTPEGQIILLDSTWMRKEQDVDQARSIKGTVAHPNCLREVYAGWDCWTEVKSRGGMGIRTADIFHEEGIGLVKADNDRVNGGRALRRALMVRDGQPGIVMVDTPGNRLVFDQLSMVLPDENNVNKPRKMNADEEGRGGDDGADMVRYGVATQVSEPTQPSHGLAPDPYPDRAPAMEPVSVMQAPGSMGWLPGEDW